MISHTIDSRSKTLVLTIDQDLQSSHVEALRKEIFDLFEKSKKSEWINLRMDLTSIKRMDSMGLNLVVNILNEVQDRNGKMSVELYDGIIRQAFLFTRLDRQIDLIVKSKDRDEKDKGG